MIPIPEAPIIRAVPNPSYSGAWLVTVRCPYGCRRGKHNHGLPDARPDADGTYGHRVEHCPSGGVRGYVQGYILTDPDGLVPR